MKKSIIALAVAGALAAPAVSMADATLYGRLHFQMQFDKDQDMNIANAGHRLGVKGESEMDSGLTAFYQIETEFRNDRAGTSTESTTDAAFTVRHANAGVKGEFGTVTVGRFNNPLNKTYVADVYERNSGVFEMAPYRIGNSLMYSTPDMSGFSADAAIIGEGNYADSTDPKDIDSYVIGGKYEANGLTAALYYQTFNFNDDIDTVGYVAGADKADDLSFGVSYTVNNFYVGYNFEKLSVDPGAASDVDTKVHDFAASYTMDKTTLLVGYGQYKTDGADTGKRTSVGVYQNLGGGADVYAEYGAYNGQAEDDGFVDNVTIGYRVKF